MNSFIKVTACGVIIMNIPHTQGNITQVQDDMTTLKQIVQSVEPFRDSDLTKFIDSNQDLNDLVRSAQIPYYRDRFEAWKNTQTITSGIIRFKKGSIAGRSNDIIQIDRQTRKPVPSFCMFGDRDAAIYVYQVLKIGQTMYLCHQWYNESWKPAHNEWGMSSVIIKYDPSQNRAIMFFWNEDGKPYFLPCGVASVLYKKEGQKIISTFFDRKNQLTELNNGGYRISKIEELENSNSVIFYLNNEKIDMQWFKIGNWREMMIYNLWSYGNGIDWED